MKRAIRFTATFILFGVASTGFAAVDDEQADRFVKQFMPSCIDQATVTREAVEIPVPDNLSVQILSVDTEDAYCAGRYLEVRTPTRIYVGYPWLLMSYEGTIDQKIKRFAWERMQQPVKVEISGEPAFDGLLPATVRQVTEYGSIPLTGYVDSGSNIFFPGQFYDAEGDARAQRTGALESLLGTAPLKGDPDAPVTVVEFSDFQCPSCRKAASFVETLVEKYGDRIAYRRVDFPLYMSHPWALPAALMGRAIYRQDPEAFWTFKKMVYSSQSELNSFTLGDFARGIVEDYELDSEEYESALGSDELRGEILEGIGIATGLQVNSTPTFWVNGAPISAGDNGADLDEAIARALDEPGE